ncbi:hypothetical protein GCM10007880_14110 [Mesorhizobium amorphae]|nr:hypothetical protein GCM10007880_14110 [Mesorhizobium amorphae]
MTPIWPRRSTIAAAPKSGEQDDPDSTDRKRRQKRNETFDTVGQDASDAVAPRHAGRAQALRCPCDTPAQFTKRERAEMAALVGLDDRDPIIVATQKVFREIERCVREKPALRHRRLIIAQERSRAGITDHAGKVPHRPPERAGVTDRPAMQRLVVARVEAVGQTKDRKIGRPERGWRRRPKHG